MCSCLVFLTKSSCGGDVDCLIFQLVSSKSIKFVVPNTRYESLTKLMTSISWLHNPNAWVCSQTVLLAVVVSKLILWELMLVVLPLKQLIDIVISLPVVLMVVVPQLQLWLMLWWWWNMWHNEKWWCGPPKWTTWNHSPSIESRLRNSGAAMVCCTVWSHGQEKDKALAQRVRATTVKRSLFMSMRMLKINCYWEYWECGYL